MSHDIMFCQNFGQL